MSRRRALTIALIVCCVAAAICAWLGWRGAIAAGLSAGAALEGWRRARSRLPTPPTELVTRDIAADDAAAKETRAAHELVEDPMQIDRSSLARDLRGNDS